MIEHRVRRVASSVKREGVGVGKVIVLLGVSAKAERGTERKRDFLDHANSHRSSRGKTKKGLQTKDAAAALLDSGSQILVRREKLQPFVSPLSFPFSLSLLPSLYSLWTMEVAVDV